MLKIIEAIKWIFLLRIVMITTVLRKFDNKITNQKQKKGTAYLKKIKFITAKH